MLAEWNPNEIGRLYWSGLANSI